MISSMRQDITHTVWKDSIQVIEFVMPGTCSPITFWFPPLLLNTIASVNCVLFLTENSGLCPHIPLSLVNRVSREEMDNFLMFWKEVLWGFLMKGISTILKRDDGGNSVGWSYPVGLWVEQRGGCWQHFLKAKKMWCIYRYRFPQWCPCLV